MPFPFSLIPAHIGDRIVQKLDLLDFVRFSVVSRYSFEAAKNVKIRYAIEEKKGIISTKRTPSIWIWLQYEKKGLKIGFSENSVVKSKFEYSCTLFLDIPVRLDGCYVDVGGTFSEEYCISLIEFLSRTSSSVKCMFIMRIACSPEALNRLIEIGKVKQLRLSRNLSSTFMEIESIKKISDFFFADFMEEAEVLALEAIKFQVTQSNLTSAGAHLIVKELMAGKREINEITISTNEPLDIDVVLKGIRCSKRKPSQRGAVVYNKNGSRFSVGILSGFFIIHKLENL